MEIPLSPSCGKCGYCVRELQTFICPECGSDLRNVGVLSDQLPQRGRRIFWMILWTIFLPFPAWLASEILIHSYLPCAVHAQVQRRIFWHIPPNETKVFIVLQEGDGWQWGDNPRPANNITIPVTHMTIAAVYMNSFLETDLKTGTYDIVARGAAVAQKSGFGESAVKDWLAANGFDLTNIRDQKGADDLTNYIDQTKPGPNVFLPGFNNNRDVVAYPTFSFQTPRPTSVFYWMILLGLWIAIWAAGIFRISRQRMIARIAPAGFPQTANDGGSARE